MAEQPVFSKIEADRILKRAAEIEGADDAGPLTVDDLRSIASEAGFGARAVERAIAEARQATKREIQRAPVHTTGVIFAHISTRQTIPILGLEFTIRITPRSILRLCGVRMPQPCHLS